MSRRTDKPRNLAASMGRWSAAHWKTATFGWLALVVVAFAIGAKVGTKSIDPNKAGPGESGRMDRILAAGFKPPAAESVLIQSPSLRARDPVFRETTRDVAARVTALAAVKGVHATRTSRDGHSALVEFSIRGDRSKAADKIGPVVADVAAAQAAHPGFFIGEMGDASAQKAVKDANLADLGKAGMLSLPITLAILTSRSVRSWPQAFRCCSRSPPSSGRSAWLRSRVTCSLWRRRCRRSCS